jgi:hypothetical protein
MYQDLTLCFVPGDSVFRSRGLTAYVRFEVMVVFWHMTYCSLGGALKLEATGSSKTLIMTYEDGGTRLLQYTGNDP